MFANVDRPARPPRRSSRSRRRATRHRRPHAPHQCPTYPSRRRSRPLAARDASFTPSPVMATTCPRARSARAMRSLSSGVTRATTTPSWSTSAPSTVLVGRKVAAARSRIVRAEQPDLDGDRARGERVVPRDHRDAYARPPTRGERLRGMRPRRVLEADEPEQVSSVSASSAEEGMPATRTSRDASTRRPRPAMSCNDSVAPGGTKQRGNTASGAPLTITVPSTTTDIRRRRASNGKRAVSTARADPRRWRRRCGERSASSAASMGSPCATHGPRLRLLDPTSRGPLRRASCIATRSNDGGTHSTSSVRCVTPTLDDRVPAGIHTSTTAISLRVSVPSCRWR